MRDNYIIDLRFSNESSDEPISPEQAKSWLYITGNDQDTVLDTCIVAARMQVEKMLNMGLVKRRITAVIENGLGMFTLPYQPMIGIVSVTDSDGQALTSDQYDVIGSRYVKINKPHGLLTVVYDAGYTNANKPDSQIIQVLKAQLAHIYEHRGDTDMAGISPVAAGLARQIRMA